MRKTFPFGRKLHSPPCPFNLCARCCYRLWTRFWGWTEKPPFGFRNQTSTPKGLIDNALHRRNGEKNVGSPESIFLFHPRYGHGFRNASSDDQRRTTCGARSPKACLQAEWVVEAQSLVQAIPAQATASHPIASRFVRGLRRHQIPTMMTTPSPKQQLESHHRNLHQQLRWVLQSMVF